MTITARSFCSGYTGLEMAVRAAFGEFTVLSHSDIKPASVALLNHRYPDIPNLGDMTRHFPGIGPITREAAELEHAELMVGSWPCVSHSAAGKRLGENDPRELWPSFRRVIQETRPAIWFGENVARITSVGELRRVVRDLADLGYVGAWRVLGARDVGACHRRDRCFIVAADTSSGGRAARCLVEQGLGESPSSWRGRSADSDQSTLTLLPTPKATDGTKGGPGMRGSSGDLMLPSAVMQLLPPPMAGGDRAYIRKPEVAQARMDSGRRMLEDAISLLPTDRWGIYTAAIARHEQVLGRPAPAPTQISARNGNPQLSARLVEFMMMLPEGWVTDVPAEVLVDSPRKSVRNAMLSLLGDGVVPLQGAAAFSFLLGHLARRLGQERAA